MPPRQREASKDVQRVPHPGRWVPTTRDGGHRWEEGTHQDLDDRHEYPHVVPRSATNLTTEFGSWEFSGPPELPEGHYEAHPETADDLSEQIAALTARRDALKAKQ